MQKIIITREKKFASAILPYWIITCISKQDFMLKHGFKEDLCEHERNGQAVSRIEINELDSIGIRIQNGETVEMIVDDDTNSFFACSMSGSLSNEVKMEGYISHPIAIKLTTKGGFKTVSYPFLTRD